MAQRARTGLRGTLKHGDDAVALGDESHQVGDGVPLSRRCSVAQIHPLDVGRGRKRRSDLDRRAKLLPQ